MKALLCGFFVALAIFFASPALSKEIKKVSLEAGTAPVQKDTYGDQLGTVVSLCPVMRKLVTICSGGSLCSII